MRLDPIFKANIELVPGVRASGSQGVQRARELRIPPSEPSRTALFCFAERSNQSTTTLIGRPKISGGSIEEAIPDPISNSEVKLLGADGTARFLVWESRTLPG